MRFIKYFITSLIVFSIAHFYFGSFRDFYDVLIISAGNSIFFGIIFHSLLQSKVKGLGKGKAIGYYVRSLSNIFKSYLYVDDSEKLFIYKWKIFGVEPNLVESCSKKDVVISNYLLFSFIKTPNSSYLLI